MDRVGRYSRVTLPLAPSSSPDSEDVPRTIPRTGPIDYPLYDLLWDQVSCHLRGVLVSSHFARIAISETPNVRLVLPREALVTFDLPLHRTSPDDGEENLQAAARVILAQIRTLASAPTHARAFLIVDDYGLGTHTPAGDAFVQTIFSGLHNLRRTSVSNGTDIPGPPLAIAFAQLSRIWDGVLGPDPGYAAFGYASTDACIVNCSLEFCSTEGMCDDPEHYFYYIPS